MRFGGQRCRRRRPREAILIDAGIAVVADARERIQIHRQLERRQLRVAADLLGRNLIHRRAEVVVRALGVLRERRAQEPRIRRVVRAGVRVLQPRVGDDRDLVFHRLERVAVSVTAGSACRRRAASIASGRIPSACTRSRASAPVWRASAPRRSPRESSHRAAAAP